MLRNVHDVDIKLLRVFYAIYEHGGFTQAQLALGISQANISAKMSKLEGRLGARLCERGASGFKLTEDGETIIAAAKRLFSALDEFQDISSSLGGELTGTLNLGIIDNAISNSNSHVDVAIANFIESAPSVNLNITIGDPSELESKLLDGSLHVAIGLFNQTNISLEYKKLYSSQHALFCGSKHEFFNLDDSEITDLEIANSRCIDRGYLESIKDLRLDLNLHTEKSNSHYNIEGVVLLVLSGRYIANLPVHFALPWTRSGKMRILKPESTMANVDILAVYKAGKSLSKVTEHFISELALSHSL